MKQNMVQFSGVPNQIYGQPQSSQVPLQSMANVVSPGSNTQNQPPVYTTGGITDIVPSKAGDGGVEVFRKGNVVMVAHKTYEQTQEQVEDFSQVIVGLESVNGHVVKIITGDINEKIHKALEKVHLVDTYYPNKKRLELSIGID